MKRYEKLYKRVRTKDGRTGVILSMLDKCFVKLDVPILRHVGKRPIELGEWFEEKDLEVIE